MQWAGLGMWVALTLSACTPTKREVGNRKRSFKIFRKILLLFIRAQKLFIRQVMKSWNGQRNFWLLI